MTHLILYLVLEPVKRVLSAVLYPLAYLLRHWLRTEEEALRHEQASSVGVVLWGHRPGWKAIWFLLDDSINAEGRIRWGKDIDYCDYGNRSRFVDWLPELWRVYRDMARGL